MNEVPELIFSNRGDKCELGRGKNRNTDIYPYIPVLTINALHTPLYERAYSNGTDSVQLAKVA